jgi:broad-specificity NMP kinase
MTSVLHLVLLQTLNEKGWSQLKIKEKVQSSKVIILKLFKDHNKNDIYSLCM